MDHYQKKRIICYRILLIFILSEIRINSCAEKYLICSFLSFTKRFLDDTKDRYESLVAKPKGYSEYCVIFEIWRSRIQF